MTAPRHVDVGAYVLGILDDPDEAAYERHFAQCEECRREFIEMADMPSLLDTLKPNKAPAGPPPALPPLEKLIDFSKLGPHPSAGSPSPAVPPQQRPNGATQPHKIPRTNGTARPAPMPPPAPGRRTNGTQRSTPTGRNAPVPPPGTGQHTPVPPPGPQGTGRHNPAGAQGTGRHTPATPPGARNAPGSQGTGRIQPVNPGTGRNAPVAGPQGTGRNPAVAPPSSGRNTPAGPAKPGARAEGTGRNAPVAGPQGTGRNLPVANPGTGKNAPVRPGGRATPVGSPTKPPAKPPTKAPTAGPAGRAAGGRKNRKPIWLTAAAAAVVALTLGVMLGLPSNDDPGNQVANPGSTAPSTPPEVAGSHVVSGTDPDTGVTAIITIEPVPDGTKIDMMLYEIEGPQDGQLFVVNRFGDRQMIAEFKVPKGGAGQGEEIRVAGVAAYGQNDINRFEIHGDGIAPLLVVPT